jgi:hypothetical protein
MIATLEEMKQAIHLTEHEDEMRSELRATPERQLLEAASTILADAIERVPDRKATVIGGENIYRWRDEACVVVAARVFRSVRAAVSTLEAGFETESQAHDRVLLALLGHYLDIASDDTGAAAKRWLQGRPRLKDGDAIQLVGISGAGFGWLSERAHGSSRPVWQALASVEGDAALVTWGPTRTQHSRAALISYSTIARVMIGALIDAFTIPMPMLPTLDDAIAKQLASFTADYPRALTSIDR